MALDPGTPSRSVIALDPAMPSPSGQDIPASPKHFFRGITAGCAAIASIAVVWALANRSPSLPSVQYSAVTSFGRVYQGEDNIERLSGVGTDGVRIYFSAIRDGRVVLTSSYVSGGGSQTLSIPTEVARPVLADISRDGSKLLVRSLPFSELEGPLWIVPASGGSASRIPGVVGHAATWLPDSTSILYASGHDLMIIPSSGSAPRKLSTLPGRAFAIRYAPDGACLRFTLLDPIAHATSLWELSADGKHLRELLPKWHNPPAECCGSWTADGAYYVFQSASNGTSNILAIKKNSGLLETTAHPIQITAGPLSYQLPLPSADGRRIFVVGAQSWRRLLVLDPSSGRPLPWFAEINARRFAFARNGQFMAWTSDEGLLWRSKLDGSQRLQLTAPTIRSFRMAWSPDGNLLAFDGREPGHRNKIYIVPASGGVPETLLHEERNESDPTWSPDGKSIVFGRLPDYLGEEPADKAIYVADFQSRNMSMLPGSVGLFSPRWSPDGRYIAAMPSDQKRLMIFDWLSAEWSGVDVPGVATSPTWSNDSKFIYFKAEKDAAIYRVSIPRKGERRIERVGGMDSLQPADSFNLVGLTPDNAPLVFTKSSAGDIYSLEWKRP
jgi:Tol biopolymer transport system component